MFFTSVQCWLQKVFKHTAHWSLYLFSFLFDLQSWWLHLLLGCELIARRRWFLVTVKPRRRNACIKFESTPTNKFAENPIILHSTHSLIRSQARSFNVFLLCRSISLISSTFRVVLNMLYAFWAAVSRMYQNTLRGHLFV